jgi:hypothetical protein
VSHVISAFAGKPIFGQDGPKYKFHISQQTICREVSILFKQNTIQVSHIFLYKFNKLYNLFVVILLKKRCACISTNLRLVVYTLVLVTKFVFSYNPQITKARIYLIYKSNITSNSGLSMLVEISEAICLLFFNFSFILLVEFWSIKKEFPFHNSSHSFIQGKWLIRETKRNYSTLSLPTNTNKVGIQNPNDTCNIFNQWLAGLIDGDGCFQLSKKGYASLEIVMEIRDKHCLYLIKQKFGGSVKSRSGINWLRYRLHHKKGLLELINAVNGEIRNPVRLLQLSKICEKYNIPVIQSSTLTYNNGWFSGFFDSDGSVYLNLKSSQMFITASQKNKLLLDPLVELYGGSIYTLSKVQAFKWSVYKKEEIIRLLDYFKLCPSRSAKQYRLKAIERYLELRNLKAHLSSPNSILGKAWEQFLLKWDKFEE